MIIAKMNEAHVAEVAALEAHCFSEPWSEKSVASELTNPLSLWLVALEGENVIGYVGSQTVMGWTDMMNVAVHPDHRRRGVGKALVRELHQIAGERLAGGGEENIIMYTCANENATGFYEKLGMVKPDDIYMLNKVAWTDFTVE